MDSPVSTVSTVPTAPTAPTAVSSPLSLCERVSASAVSLPSLACSLLPPSSADPRGLLRAVLS
eukprot:2679711-Rhodomonas_salina.1